MKQIELNGIKYNVPTSWEDITIKDQIRVSEISQKYTGLTSQLQLLAGYSNIPVDVLKHINIKHLPELLSNLEFINEPLNQDPISKFEYKGDKYYVMPTLIDGEFQDFISLESVIQMYAEKPADGLPFIIAILCKREGETLDSFDIEERAKHFLDLPIDIANRVSVFFSQLEKLSMINTPTFLEQYQKEVDKKAINQLNELENTMKQSDGQGWLGRLQRKILLKYVQYLKKNYISYLTGTVSK